MSTPNNPPSTHPDDIRLLPLEPADIPTWIHLHQQAFTPSLLTQIMYAGTAPLSPAGHAIFAANRLRGLVNDPTAAHIKAVSSATGDILAVAKWHIYATPRTDADLEDDRKVRDLMPENHPEAFPEFMRALAESEERSMGKRPHVALSSLAVDPRVQGKGLGRRMVEWGCREADRLGLEVYLESTERGRRLYRSCGFQEIGRLAFGLERWGMTACEELMVMIRPANKAAVEASHEEKAAEGDEDGLPEHGRPSGAVALRDMIY